MTHRKSGSLFMLIEQRQQPRPNRSQLESLIEVIL